LTTTTAQSVVVKTQFETETEDSPDMYIGESELLKNGTMGEDRITIFSEYDGWGLVNSTQFTEILTEPISEIMLVGTKQYPTLLSNDGQLILPCNGVVTSTDKSGSHEGYTAVDIANSIGSPLYAPEDCVITMAEYYGGYGNCLQMSGGKYSFLFGHLSAFNVSVGQEVSKGDIIGFMGSTGNSTGSHLHLEVYINGEKQYIPNVFNLGMGDTI